MGGGLLGPGKCRFLRFAGPEDGQGGHSELAGQRTEEANLPFHGASLQLVGGSVSQLTKGVAGLRIRSLNADKTRRPPQVSNSFLRIVAAAAPD